MINSNKSLLHAGIAACMVSTSALADVPESTDPIQVIDNNWSSQKVLARVAQQMLEQIGYKAELVTLDTQSQFAAMGTGDAHIQMEVWEGSMNASFMKEVEAGRMIDGGSHTATTREEWWYPNYVEEVCPGLPDYKALNDCAEKAVDAGNRSERPLSRRTCGMASGRPRARRSAWTERDGRQRGLRGCAVRRAEVRRRAQGADHLCSTGRRTGWAPPIPASSSSFPVATRRTSALRIRAGASTRI